MFFPGFESFLSITLVALVICGDSGSAQGQSDSNSAGASGTAADDEQQEQRPRQESSISQRLRERLQNFDIDNIIAEFNAGGNMDRFTPSPVINPNCHVEVQVTRRYPGRCVRLATGRDPPASQWTPACQSEVYLSPNDNECT